MRPWYAVTCVPGTRRMTNSAATRALERPTSLVLRGEKERQRALRGARGGNGASCERYSRCLRLARDSGVRHDTWLLYAPEEKLAVQVAGVDGVHVDEVDVAEARERQIGEQLATEAAGADDEHLCRVAQHLLRTGARSVKVQGRTTRDARGTRHEGDVGVRCAWRECQWRCATAGRADARPARSRSASMWAVRERRRGVPDDDDEEASDMAGELGWE